jgi:hypothetical protein
MDCNQRLLQPPPDNFFNIQGAFPGQNGGQHRRSAFMICMMTHLVNQGVLDYKVRVNQGVLDYKVREATSNYFQTTH